MDVVQTLSNFTKFGSYIMFELREKVVHSSKVKGKVLRVIWNPSPFDPPCCDNSASGQEHSQVPVVNKPSPEPCACKPQGEPNACECKAGCCSHDIQKEYIPDECVCLHDDSGHGTTCCSTGPFAGLFASSWSSDALPHDSFSSMVSHDEGHAHDHDTHVTHGGAPKQEIVRTKPTSVHQDREKVLVEYDMHQLRQLVESVCERLQADGIGLPPFFEMPIFD